MASESDGPMDRLWREYCQAFSDFDDLTLARWLSQTLGQIQGRLWRMSHPLIGTFRLAAQLGHDRQIWLKRLATFPSAYPEAPCCRAPLLPLFTRDVTETGLICQHCGETCVAFEELPGDLRRHIRKWADEYQPVHAVAHWTDSERQSRGNYDNAYESAASQAEELLASGVREILLPLLEHYPALVWEDQDECLEVRPEDIEL